MLTIATACYHTNKYQNPYLFTDLCFTEFSKFMKKKKWVILYAKKGIRQNKKKKSEKIERILKNFRKIYFFVYVNIFKRTHGPYVDISKHFADHLPTPNCKRNLWRLPNENRFFPVRKSSQGKPCSGPVLALYGIAV